MITKLYTAIFLVIALAGCKKGFLDKKPNSNIILPSTLTNYQNLLDNHLVNNVTGALPMMASDEYYFVDYTAWQSMNYATVRNSYIWAADLYNGEVKRPDWNTLYSSIFSANNVLDNLKSADSSSTPAGLNIRGQALFIRAHAYFDLARNFCTAYSTATASSELGLPLRTSAGVDVVKQRSSLKDTYDFIIADLRAAFPLLKDNFSVDYRNRSSKAAVTALLCRVYLAMGEYGLAEASANHCLSLYDKLIDYNTVSQTSATPFAINNEEVIYSTTFVNFSEYPPITYGDITSIAIDSNLLKLYDPVNDLRFPIFFKKNTAGKYNIKRGYGSSSVYPFTGLATDEIYLIKAECLARRGILDSSMIVLNNLIRKRYKTNTFQNNTAATKVEALEKILTERRKELVWRGLRWSDLKRLNLEGSSITLTRVLNGVTYTLPPNDKKYVFPIPDDEIVESGIAQNIR